VDFPERVETERLLLRWPTDADAEEIFARYASDPVVTRYMMWKPHRSVEETREYLKKKEAERESSGGKGWLLTLKTDGLLVGMIGCRPVESHILQFGYCLAQDMWGRGFATEAARALVDVWLDMPDIWRVQAHCDLENVASARVLEKAGLSREGTLRRFIVAPNTGPVPRDVYVYARVREQ
jgi:RimJ/RimL family protein N-acetyltransferase